MEYSPNDSVRLAKHGAAIEIIDQTRLPSENVVLQLYSSEEIYDALKTMKVRGAPAIGICGGYAMYVMAQHIICDNFRQFISELERYGHYIMSVRPTAVNLSAAINMALNAAKQCDNKEDAFTALKETAFKIHEDTTAMCKAIAENGLKLIKNHDGILTHCNAGPLASAGYGTALGPILLGKERGYTFHVYANETRPLLQGARLTAYELNNAGVDVTLVCESAASFIMKRGFINAVLVGCDRIAANGDTANKIGTNSIAIIADYYNIPVYVLGPTSTIDFSCKSAADIPIEYRDNNEIRTLFSDKPTAPEVKCLNPAFDVTPAKLITAIVTEKGICEPPFDESLAKACGIEL